jgi:prepilin-type N-terminal cleavage/methylation domain-containing protein
MIIRAHKMSKKKQKGFTFIELILVVSMMAMIGFAVYGAFSLGIGVFRATSKEKPFNDLAVFYEKFSMDIRNILFTTEIDFKGFPDKLFFYVNDPGYIIFPKEPEIGEKPKTIKKVEYEILEDGRMLRKVYEYGSSEPYLVSTALEDSRGIKFEYFEEDKKEFIDSAGFVPAAIRVSSDDGVSENQFTSRIFEIPVSG